MANQAILEATDKYNKIHILDFGILHGIQWAAFLQAVSTRPTGRPVRIRISGIPAPSLGKSATTSLMATGNQLSDFSKLLDLNFDFKPFMVPFHELKGSSFQVEVLPVNFMHQLYNLLDESNQGIELTLRLVKSLNPRLVTLDEYRFFYFKVKINSSV